MRVDAINGCHAGPILVAFSGRTVIGLVLRGSPVNWRLLGGCSSGKGPEITVADNGTVALFETCICT